MPFLSCFKNYRVRTLALKLAALADGLDRFPSLHKLMKIQ